MTVPTTPPPAGTSPSVALHEVRDAQAPGLRPPLPRFAQIEPIGRCNLACRMCGVNERGDAVGSLSLQRLRELLDAMPGLERLHLQGLGEPLLHPDFFAMVALAASRGLRVSANTNLTLLTEARAERCVRSGLEALSVSIDGASAEVYEGIRRKAAFAKVVRNLGRLTRARDRAGSTLQVRGVMVLMRGNLHELPALVRLLHEHGVHELLVQRLAGSPGSADDPARRAVATDARRYIAIADYIDQSELRGDHDMARAGRIFDEARALAAQLQLRLHLPRLVPKTAEAASGAGAAPRCGWPWEQLYVTAAGEMLPCCMVGSADRATFGPVFGADASKPADPLAAWHGAPAQQFRRALSEGPPPAVCRDCALYHGRF